MHVLVIFLSIILIIIICQLFFIVWKPSLPEKLNEILINSDEIRYTWEYENMYMILNPSVQKHTSIDEFSNTQKVTDMIDYSSGNVEKFSKNEMKSILTNSGLLH